MLLILKRYSNSEDGLDAERFIVGIISDDIITFDVEDMIKEDLNRMIRDNHYFIESQASITEEYRNGQVKYYLFYRNDNLTDIEKELQEFEHEYVEYFVIKLDDKFLYQDISLWFEEYNNGKLKHIAFF